MWREGMWGMGWGRGETGWREKPKHYIGFLAKKNHFHKGLISLVHVAKR